MSSLGGWYTFAFPSTAVEADRRFDGKFVLRTNTGLSPAEVAKTYKGLWRMERTFREK